MRSVFGDKRHYFKCALFETLGQAGADPTTRPQMCVGLRPHPRTTRSDVSCGGTVAPMRLGRLTVDYAQRRSGSLARPVFSLPTELVTDHPKSLAHDNHNYLSAEPDSGSQLVVAVYPGRSFALRVPNDVHHRGDLRRQIAKRGAQLVYCDAQEAEALDAPPKIRSDRCLESMSLRALSVASLS